MASGRPRQPNDPSIMASVEAALSGVPRPGLIPRMWHWRYELGLTAGVLLGTIGIAATVGPGWLIAAAAATMAILAVALMWPPVTGASGWPYADHSESGGAESEDLPCTTGWDLTARSADGGGGGQLPAAPAPSGPPSPSTATGAVVRTERARSCATSTTSSVSLASPELFFAAMASPSMTRQ